MGYISVLFLLYFTFQNMGVSL